MRKEGEGLRKEWVLRRDEELLLRGQGWGLGSRKEGEVGIRKEGGEGLRKEGV